LSSDQTPEKFITATNLWSTSSILTRLSIGSGHEIILANHNFQFFYKVLYFSKINLIQVILMEKNSSMTEKTAHGMEKTAETMANTLLAVIDKLAGKESDLKLSFEDLTLDLGMMKAKLNGAIILDIVYAKETEGSSKSK
jgi:hypothetical protein